MTAQLEVYPRRDGRWAWRLCAANGQVIATDGGQGYERPGAAHAIATRIIAGGLADAHVTTTNHPDLSGDTDMADTETRSTTRYAVARRGKIITSYFSDPDSANSELDGIKNIAARIGITDSLKIVEVDVEETITTSDPRDYFPPTEDEDVESAPADNSDGDTILETA